jgi:hypothetical protein
MSDAPALCEKKTKKEKGGEGGAVCEADIFLFEVNVRLEIALSSTIFCG